MKNSNNFKSAKLLVNFEIGNDKLAAVSGGYTEPTAWSTPGNAACSHECPDYNVDVRSSNGTLISSY